MYCPCTVFAWAAYLQFFPTQPFPALLEFVETFGHGLPVFMGTDLELLPDGCSSLIVHALLSVFSDSVVLSEDSAT